MHSSTTTTLTTPQKLPKELKQRHSDTSTILLTLQPYFLRVFNLRTVSTKIDRGPQCHYGQKALECGGNKIKNL